MADKKISALTASTTPLAGTEVLPIVQSGSTVQVSVANLTAGRAVGASTVTATGKVSGNYVTASGVVESTGGNLGHAASRVIMSYEGSGNSYIQPYSTSSGTQGTLYIRCNSSDGSLSTFAAQFDASNVTVSTGNLVIGTTSKGITTGSSIPLGLGTNNSVTAVTIDTASNVGIGTTSPVTILDVQAANNVHLGVRTGELDATAIQLNAYNNAGSANIPMEIKATNFVFNRSGSAAMVLNTSNNVGIGTSSPAATAILDVQSTTKGVRFPNMTTVQKTAITPSAGTVVFDTTLSKLCVYSGAAWQTITSV